MLIDRIMIEEIREEDEHREMHEGYPPKDENNRN